MSTSGLPFDDFRELISQLPEASEFAGEAVREREARLSKPVGSLGRLEEIAEWLAAWSGKAKPQIMRPLVAIFAGNHGVLAQGVSSQPQSLTMDMVNNFAAGGAAINQICIANDLGLKVFDLALEHPTEDITVTAAMDERTCAATMAFGMEAIAGGTDLLCIGEMGVGNTTIAAAISLALFGDQAEDWVSLAAGEDASVLPAKIAAVKKAVALNEGNLRDPLEVLRRLGGRELAAITGAILAARAEKIPVLIDGYVASAAAAILLAMNGDALDHCLFSHVSSEPGHRLLLEKMGKTPLLDLNISLGSGTGAALAAGLVKTAAQCHVSMATAEDAGMNGRSVS
ncbi:nicotinate-nucleotide--dimethylbenzimidazole phosphoribosyltransferase [Pseudochrobactrum algeriensis]|uniref:nicotinate-nucleotide--dimethylbenzimidazole phosphoribosyltransferase n=1 Tax=Pseudochrobactrum algeriensis TaxID=2834768 RepID=UPI001BCB5899|nr:nicotinate-nucleotide--dimethylbenzimidazole phosphoribosyltransferase [Pseudochrobactrum algeriensis]QVQ35686.1 nicotinate-nucleotide--dimethylbenzimidazole phosphoribosyltransferase [Pseudochrobactrum algeriensis]QVQ38907.1 nicotinate-nucleotide--dimethylbenzimidazole phosphoribosyltransferase [Pseudochrobactrum algeriensis]QVQ42820.1 nicotinate-nucleotide--dimethylbenzimidazole phosphoribosyltransferase [Pseudochrobactrum algeriensis]